MRRRRSTSASSGTLMRKGRIALSSVVPIGESPWFDGWLVGVSPAAAAAASCAGSRLTAPAAAEPARTLRRVGDDDTADMFILPVGTRGFASPILVKNLARSKQWTRLKIHAGACKLEPSIMVMKQLP